MSGPHEPWTLLDGVMAAWPAGVALFDTDLRMLRSNTAMRSFNGGRDLTGRRLDEVLGPDAAPVIAHLRSVIESGRPVRGQRITRGGAPGPAEFLGDYYPVKGPDGRVVAVAAAVLDVTVVGELALARDQALARAEGSRQALAALQATTVAVAEATSIAAVVDVVLGVGLRAAGADAGVVVFVEPGSGLARVVAATGYEQVEDRMPTELPMDGSMPLTHTAVTGEPLFGSLRDDLVVRFPQVAELAAVVPHHSLATLPLRAGSELMGALALSFDEPQPFDADQVAALTTMADLSAAALVRVRLLEEEERSRAAAAAAAERNAFLAQATALVSAPLDERRVLERLARLCVPRLGDWCSITRPRGDRLERVIVYHHDPSLDPVARRLQQSLVPITGSNPAAVTFRTGRSQLLRDIDQGAGEVIGPDTAQEMSELLRRMGSAHGIVVPLGPPTRPLGVLAFAVRSPRVLTDDDVSLAAEIALRAGIAVDHAQSFARERDAATSLQRAILPAALPTVAGVDIAATYLPSGSGRTVGGDWYDAFALGPDQLGLAVGDVAGHGLSAASAMAQLRHALRAYLVEGHGPGEALRRLNRLVAGEATTSLATVVAATLDVATGAVVVANAGHLPPLRASRTGACEMAVGVHGPMLGAVPDAAYPEMQLRLGTGDALVLFTDGLVERRSSTLDDTMDDLCRAVEQAPPTPERLQRWCDELVESQLASRSHDDDSCALIVRLGNRPLRLELAPGSGAARMIRRELQARYGDHPRLQELQLCATEVVTNAVVHAHPPVRVAIEDQDDVICFAVHDASPTMPVMRPFGSTSAHGRGLHLLDALAERWGVELGGDGKAVWFHFRR